VVLDALWDFRAPFDKMLGHAGAVSRIMADNETIPVAHFSALLGLWFVKAAMKPDAPSTPLEVLTKVIAAAAARPGISTVAAGKLWQAFRQLVEFHHGNSMDESKESEAIRQMGRECAQFYKLDANAGELLQSSLRRGLTAGTSDEAHFVSGYTRGLHDLATSGGDSAR
jgi:hypothetical protein